MSDKPSFSQHISRQFNAELEDVRQRVLAMGGLVEQQIVDATRALVEPAAGAAPAGGERPASGGGHHQDHHRSGTYR